MPTLVLVRHGQSLWNAENKFTGWEDIDLSPKGEQEALEAGLLIQSMNIQFNLAWTSYLKRAIRTLYFILNQNAQLWMPVHKSWRLNERHYGQLQGLNKEETIQKYGKEQVFQWRRSFDTPPPLLDPDSAEHPCHHPAYKEVPKEQLPLGESLKGTMDRVMPLWNSIEEKLKQNQNILIVAHGNSLRSLVKYIKNIDDEQISLFEIPTASPLVFEWESVNHIPHQIKRFEFLKK